MALNIIELWDFAKPEESEERFQNLLTGASTADEVILKTQIARSFGIRGDFDIARNKLSEVATLLDGANEEGHVRYWLELGRTYCSATHSDESQTASAVATGRDCFMRSFDLARTARLDYLAIDALHMMTMVDTSAGDQIEWNEKALALVEASDQVEAKLWEASLRNNLGYAYGIAGRQQEALAQYRLSLAAATKVGKVRPIRVANWMIASTLRKLGHTQEALEIQQRLEREWDADGQPSLYVYQELQALYKGIGDVNLEATYATKVENHSQRAK